MQWSLTKNKTPWATKHSETWQKYRQLLQHYTQTKKYAELDLFTTTKIWIVSDGGLKQTDGSYGWVIASDTDILYEGKGRVSSNPSKIDSLRVESMGMFHALT